MGTTFSCIKTFTSIKVPKIRVDNQKLGAHCIEPISICTHKISIGDGALGNLKHLMEYVAVSSGDFIRVTRHPSRFCEYVK